MSEMTNHKVLSYLGLAMRAGKIINGDEGVLESIRNGKAKLVIVAEDASQNTRKKFQDKCKFYRVKLVLCCSRSELGASIGKSERVSIAITDTGFVQMIQKCIVNHSEVENIE